MTPYYIENLFCTGLCPKQFGLIQNNVDKSKKNWTGPKWSKIILDQYLNKQGSRCFPEMDVSTYQKIPFLRLKKKKFCEMNES